MINEERLLNLFLKLQSFDSLSFHENEILEYVYNILKELGLKVEVDNVGDILAKDNNLNNHSKGNIYAYLKGNLNDSILFSSHLDTVSPGINKKAIISDGIIKSDGKTVLGADDVSGLATIIEALRTINEKKLNHNDIELLITIAEEPYCQGSRYFNFEKIKSKKAYVLDLDGPLGRCAIKAPSIISFTLEIFGKSAHAGFSPEDGINAITILGNALSRIKVGRIDDNTTLNFGKVYGGEQRNSIPDYVNIIGEIRSLDSIKAFDIMQNIIYVFNEEAKKINGNIKASYKEEIKAYNVDPSSDVIKKYNDALNEVGLDNAKLITTCGGSDNNNINKFGIEGIVISNGMNKPHTTDEYIKIDELNKTAEIVLNLMTK